MSNNERALTEEEDVDQALSINLSEFESKGFSGIVLVSAFHQSIRRPTETERDIAVKEYILAYNEVVKFLEKLGAMFYFVVADVREKVHILDSCLAEKPDSYATISKLVAFEIGQNYLVKGRERPNNGARTVLRLHRALLFVYELVQNLWKASANTSASQICVAAYDSTLAPHHSWVVRQAARLGMRVVPNRDTIIAYMATSPDELEKFPIFFAKILDVYDITQAIYEKNELLELP